MELYYRHKDRLIEDDKGRVYTYPEAVAVILDGDHDHVMKVNQAFLTLVLFKGNMEAVEFITQDKSTPTGVIGELK